MKIEIGDLVTPKIIEKQHNPFVRNRLSEEGPFYCYNLYIDNGHKMISIQDSKDSLGHTNYLLEFFKKYNKKI